MSLTADVIEAVLKNLTDRLALAAFFLCVCLFIVLGIFPTSTVGIWTKEHQIWVLLVLMGSVCYLPTRWVFDKVTQFGAEHKRHQRLHNLTKEEKELLAPYIQNDYRSMRIFHADPVARGLADDGVLYAPDVIRDNLGHAAYNIQDWARLYLKKHAEALSGIPNTPKAGDS